MGDKLNYCNTCPRRANCSWYKENDFCKIDNDVLDQVYSYNRARHKEFSKFMDAKDREEINPNCKYFKKVRKEVSELVEYFEELRREKEDDENARLQEA